MAEYLFPKGYPNELVEKLLGAVFIVESGFHEDDDAFVLLAETESDKKHISQKYNIAYPEYTERIETPLGAWEKSVYIFSDTGEGMIYFAPVGEGEITNDTGNNDDGIGTGTIHESHSR